MARWWRRGWCVPERERVHFGRPRERRITELRSLIPGRLDGVSLVAAPELSEPLAPGHVRVSVRAAGMNFRDVLIALGQIDSPGIGFEFAGVVEAVGADVTSVAVGDRVFGFGLGCFGTRAVTAAHLVAKVPAGCRLRRQRRCRLRI